MSPAEYEPTRSTGSRHLFSTKTPKKDTYGYLILCMAKLLLKPRPDFGEPAPSRKTETSALVHNHMVSSHAKQQVPGFGEA